MEDKNLAEKVSAKMHAQDKCAHTLGMQVDKVASGKATVSMLVRKEFANGHGYCQGGIITTLADTAFAHACNSYNRSTVAQGLSIEFVRPAIVNEKLTAVAIELSRGKLTGIYQVNVFNPQQKLVATMTGKAFEHGDSIVNK